MPSASQGAYYARNTAAAVFTLPAANSSNPRIERICLTIFDASYEGSANEGKLEVLAGTASAGATLSNLTGVAAAPKASMTIAFALVPPGATTISNADIKNVAARVTLGIPPFTFTQPGGSATLNSGEFAELPTGSTATLPAATAGQLIGVFAGVTASGVVKITSPSPIYGDFTDAATTINLAFLQHVLLLGGPGYWLIIAGESKREQEYSALTERTSETEYEPSAARTAFVTLLGESAEAEKNISLTTTIGGGVYLGQTVGGYVASGKGTTRASFLCPPGVKWKAKVQASSGAAKLFSSYLLL